MYFIPSGLLVKAYATDDFWKSIETEKSRFDSLTLDNLLYANLVPVTLGNIVGGADMVRLVYWFIHRPTTESTLTTVNS